MELEGVRYVFAAYAAVALVLVVWLAMIAAKVRRLDRAADEARQREGAA
jgi:hypothetical protein